MFGLEVGFAKLIGCLVCSVGALFGEVWFASAGKAVNVLDQVEAHCGLAVRDEAAELLCSECTGLEAADQYASECGCGFVGRGLYVKRSGVAITELV